MPFDDVDVFRVITDQEVIHIQRTFDTRRNDLNNRVNFQTKQSDRQDTALRNTHFLVIQLWETWTYPHLKAPSLKKTFNKRRQSASQTCTVQVSHDSIFIANCVPKLVATSLSTYGSPSNTWFLRPIRAHNPNVIGWLSSFLTAHQHIIGHSVP